MSTTNTLAKSFHNAFPVSAIGGADESQFYVQRAQDDAHDPVAEMKQALDWEDFPGCYLFSGLRGAGKTTELNRLVCELAATDIAAYYCDSSAYLDLTDPNIGQAELILTALAGLSDAVKKEHGKDVLLDSIWDRTKRLMNSNVELKPKLKSSIMGSEIEAEFSLEENPDFKKNLISFSQESSDFFQEAQQFASILTNIIKEKSGKTKIVLIVDSLERISAPAGSEQALFDSLKELFFNNPARLAFADFSVIYTVPPYLHAVLPNIDNHFSGTFSLANFKVMLKPTESNTGDRNEEGIAKMVTIVGKRFAQWQEIIHPIVLAHLAWMSGGNVRRLFSLLRHLAKKAVLNKVNFPVSNIDDASVLQAISEETKPLQWLNAKDREWLKYCRDHSGDLAKNIINLEQDLPPIIRLFDHSLVLNYQNGSVWYQVPPLVRDHV